MNLVKKYSRQFLNVLKIVISISLIILLLWMMRDNLDEVLKALKRTDLSWYGITFLLYLLIMLILSYRMKIVFAIPQVYLSLKEALQLNFVGYFFNNFLPTAAGGDIAKAYLGSKLTKKGMETIVATLVDRAVGAYSIFLIAGITLIFVRRELNNNVLSFVVWGILIALTVLLLIFPVLIKGINSYLAKKEIQIKGNPASRFSESTLHYWKRKKESLGTIGMSILTNVLSVIGVYFLTLGLDLVIPFATLLWVIPLVFVINMLPSINGLGIRESAFVFFFGSVVGIENAFALSILWFSVYLLIDIVGGFIFLFSKNLRAFKEPQGS